MDRLPTHRPRATPAGGGAPRSLRPAALFLAISLFSSAIASSVTAFAIVPSLAGPAAASAPAPAADSGPGSGAPAVEATPAPSDGDGAVDPIVDVAARVSPAVVTITASGAIAQGPFNVPSTGVGSGVLFRADGWILTNAHVVEGASGLVVTLRDGRQLPGRSVEIDTDRDLAIVKVDATGLPTAELGRSADLQVGELVIAIGSPLGEFTNSVTSGILSAIGRTISVPDERGRVRALTDLLQTDAAINPGNSGGPLLDAHGRVIGIDTAIASGADGIGFAIPIDRATDIIAAAIGNSSI